MRTKLAKLITLFSRGNFKVRYAVALLIIAILSTFLQVVVQLNLENQKTGLTQIQSIRAHLSEIESIRKRLFTVQTIPDTTKFYVQLESTAGRLTEALQHEIASKLERANVEAQVQKVAGLTTKTDRAEASALLFDLNQELAAYGERGSLQMRNADIELNRQLDRFRLIELSILVLTLLVLVAEDLLIFRPAIRKLDQALQDRSDFFSRIGHEIRNPMNSILGTVELMSETQLSPTQRNYLFRLKNSAQGLLNFLNNMIDYSSVENKHITVSMDEIETKEFITELTSLFSLDTYRKGLDFYIYTDNLPAKLRTDVIKVRHIVLNLLGNAIKFTAKGSIFLSLTHNSETKQLIIRVRDTGIGIPPEKKDLIFNAFTQADSSIKRKHGGTGLGLAIAREYLDVLNGKIAVNSEIGKGSEFIVTLPLVGAGGKFEATLPPYKKIYVSGSEELLMWVGTHRHRNTEIVQFSGEKFQVGPESNCAILIDRTVSWEKISAPHCELLLVDLAIDKVPPKQFKEIVSLYPVMAWDIGREEPAAEASLNEMNASQRVLICDDAPENRFILKAFLQKIYSQIDEASGGEECLTMCSQNQYDVVFLDIQMPDIDGYSVIAELKKKNFYQSKGKIIACTAHSSELESEKITRLGFNGHLIKPISFQSILTVLEATHKPPKDDDFEERVRKRIAQQRPLFVQMKKDEVKELEKQGTPNLNALKNFGHKMKGSAATFGFPELQDLGAKLETASDQRDQSLALDYYQQIKDILEALPT